MKPRSIWLAGCLDTIRPLSTVSINLGGLVDRSLETYQHVARHSGAKCFLKVEIGVSKAEN